MLTKLNGECHEENARQILRLQHLEQNEHQERGGGHEEKVVEDGGEYGARPVRLGGVVGDEVGEEQGSEADGGVDETDTQNRGTQFTVWV